MIIAIIQGEAGTGKSKQAGTFVEEGKTVIFDEENRLAEYNYDKDLIPTTVRSNITFSDYTNITLIPLQRIKPDYKPDTVGSFDAYVDQVRKTLNSSPPKTLIIDGISDIRDYASDKWKKQNNRKSENNPGDRKQVNDMVKAELFPLINWARIHDVNLIFTSQMKDDYKVYTRSDGKEDAAKCGRIPDHKDYFAYNVDLVIELWRPLDKNKKPLHQFMASVIKSARETTFDNRDITGISLYQVLLEEGLLL